MLILLFLLSVLRVVWSGHASYLGGDIDQYAEISKKSELYPKSHRPITARQLEDYKTYQNKFSDIAKAYAEGYKAAIQAVQARALIAQRRLLKYKKSKIPLAPKNINAKDVVPEENLGQFKNAVPNLVTVTGTDKSSIPHPAEFKRSLFKRSIINEDKPKTNGFHRGIPSISLTEEKRAEIARLNAAALHRNVYMDGMGGVSYGGMGGVLSRQGWRYKKKHRRSIEDEPTFVSRHRRSHMPYLGQNLDRIGVVRVKPNWNEPAEKKTNLPKPEIITPQSAHHAPPVASTLFGKPFNPFIRHNIPPPPWQQRMQVPVNPYYPFQGQMPFQNPYGAYMFPVSNGFSFEKSTTNDEKKSIS